MIEAMGYAARHANSRLKPLSFERDEAGPREVEVQVLFCGVCHSDIHQVKDDWGNTVYPCMPGHEIVGRVTRVGEGVTRHAVGDLVGVGCMIDSCGECDACKRGEQQYCGGPNSWLATYNGPMVPAAKAPTRENMYGRDNTYGGYSSVLVVREDFVLKIPPALDAAAAAPVLCAGVTTYSPMKQWGVQAGSEVGVIGLGGLGHMAVKLAKAMGASVTVFTSSKDKLQDAERLGARGVLEKDKAALKGLASKLDFILSTVPEKHDLNPFVTLLKRDRTLCAVGALEPMVGLDNMQLAFHRTRVAGSLIGSIAETQEVLDFCAQHGIPPDIERIPIQDINHAFKRVNEGDVRFRYVIDMATLADED